MTMAAGTYATVKVGAVAVPALTKAVVSADVDPTTVPIVRFCRAVLAAMLWLIENCVVLIICEMNVPNGIPTPATG